jgi:single-strand DNA-binding protein
MTASLNRVQIIGHLGKDPELKHLSGSKQVANLSIATVESWKDKSGTKQQKTEWHRVACYDKLADIADQYLKKGGQVFIEGKLETKEWTDKKTGEVKRATGIIGEKLLMLGKKEGAPKERDNGFSRNDDDGDDYEGDPWA